MAKLKNHTNRNQKRKHHRNGIKKKGARETRSLAGLYRPMLKNMRYAKAGNRKAMAKKAITA